MNKDKQGICKRTHKESEEDMYIDNMPIFGKTEHIPSRNNIECAIGKYGAGPLILVHMASTL